MAQTTPPGMAANLTFSAFARPVLNGSTTSFYAQVAGPGITAANDEGLWAKDVQGLLKLLVYEGMPAPGLGPGVTFKHIYRPYCTSVGPPQPCPFSTDRRPTMNSTGQIYFNATLALPGGLINESIWVGDASGTIAPVIRYGDTVQLGPGDLQTVLTVEMWDSGSGGQDGLRSAVNDSGQIAVWARLSGESGDGVYVVTIPEPATALLAIVALCLLPRVGTRCRISFSVP
jgi:hypothetical protein